MRLNLIIVLAKALVRWRVDRKYLRRLHEVTIEESGESEDGLALIRLAGGKIFYGYKSDMVHRVMYKLLLPKKLKKKLHIAAVNLGVDIAKRYLKPESRQHAIRASKLVDVNTGDVIVEGGAYIGLYAIQLAERVGASGKIIAIEAIEDNFKVMKKNLESNGVQNVIAINKGIWNRKEDLKYFRSKKQAASYSESVLSANPVELQIEADTLDNILRNLSIEKVDIIRLQTNGAELKGLEGMPSTLAQRPKMLVAVPYIVDGTNMRKEVESFLQHKGFSTELRGESIFAT